MLIIPTSSFGDVLALPLVDMKPSLDLGDDSPYKLSVHGFTARRFLYFWKINFTK
jgi:hypothetical protein